jgi:CheY-like chemotaxis protein
MARILLAEDQTELSRMMASALRLDGHQVEIEADGANTLEGLLASQFDMAILDVHLPGMSGIEICEKLSAEGNMDEVHILMISADANPIQLEKCLALGAEAYLNKPFSVQVLLKEVDRILSPQPS